MIGGHSPGILKYYKISNFTWPFVLSFLPPSLVTPPLGLYGCVPQFLTVDYLSHHTEGMLAGKHNQLNILEGGGATVSVTNNGRSTGSGGRVLRASKCGLSALTGTSGVISKGLHYRSPCQPHACHFSPLHPLADPVWLPQSPT